MCIFLRKFRAIVRWNYASCELWIWHEPWQGLPFYVFLWTILRLQKIFIVYLIAYPSEKRVTFSMITEHKSKRIFAAYLLAILNKIKYCLVIIREFITLKLEILFFEKKIQNKINSFLMKFMDLWISQENSVSCFGSFSSRIRIPVFV